MARGERALFQREHPGQDLQEGGLSGAVWPDKDRALTALHLEVQPGVDDVGSVGLLHTLEGDHPLPSAAGLWKTERDRRLVPLGGLDAFHPFQLLHSVLCLCRLAGLGTEAVDEALQFGDLFLLVFVGCQVLLLAGLLQHEVLVVVAAVAVELAVSDLEHALADGIQEFAVMGDGHDRAAIVGEVVLEPSQRFQIQMIRRLIEHQEIGFHDQKSGKVCAHDPSSAQGARRLVDIRISESQTVEDSLGFDREAVAVKLGKTGVGLVMDRVVLARMITQQTADFLHGAGSVGGQFQHGLIPGRGALLGKESDADIPLQGNGSRVRGILPQDQGEQGRFSRPVGSDQSDAVSTVDLQGGILEQWVSPEGFGEVGDGEHDEWTGGRRCRATGRIKRRFPRRSARRCSRMATWRRSCY